MKGTARMSRRVAAGEEEKHEGGGRFRGTGETMVITTGADQYQWCAEDSVQEELDAVLRLVHLRRHGSSVTKATTFL